LKTGQEHRLGTTKEEKFRPSIGGAPALVKEFETGLQKRFPIPFAREHFPFVKRVDHEGELTVLEILLGLRPHLGEHSPTQCARRHTDLR
jgi:hypothetical protein